MHNNCILISRTKIFHCHMSYFNVANDIGRDRARASAGYNVRTMFALLKYDI